jgi:NAD(P)-dependent dehydrogenase (short-subunit alcohol dehydrogenase family)
MKLKDKVALITGSTSGIGKATAILFAQEGAKIIVTGRNEERGNATVAEIEAAGGEATFIRADLLQTDQITNLLEESIKTYGKLDILYNNSGIVESSFTFEDLTEKIWDDVFDTNIKAVYLLTQKALPYLLETKGNVLVNASIAGIRPLSGHAYCAVKSAVIMLTQTLATTYAEKGIRVNAILPGLTETPILDPLDKEMITALEAGIPMKRMAADVEMAKPALFLASDEASYITGHALVVDGGLSLVK